MLDFITENKITIFKVIYGIAIFSLFFWFFSREDKVDSLNDLEIKSLNGIILSIEAKTHGYYRVYIVNKTRSDTMCYELYGNHFFNKQNNVIKAGDSISKDKNSRILLFHSYVFHSYKSRNEYKKPITYILPFDRGYKLNDIKNLENQSLNGIVLSLKTGIGDDYHIGILNKIKGDTLCYNLSGNYLFSDKYNINIGDSISKDTNSRMMTFYSYEGKGVYKEGVLYELPSSRSIFAP